MYEQVRQYHDGQLISKIEVIEKIKLEQNVPMTINFQAKVAVPQGLDPRRVDTYLGKILLGDIQYFILLTSEQLI